jgi:hypothetical protein
MSTARITEKEIKKQKKHFHKKIKNELVYLETERLETNV